MPAVAGTETGYRYLLCEAPHSPIQPAFAPRAHQDRSSRAYPRRGGQVIDVPAPSRRSVQMTFHPLLEVSPGAAGVEIPTGGELEPTERTHLERQRGRKLQTEHIQTRGHLSRRSGVDLEFRGGADRHPVGLAHVGTPSLGNIHHCSATQPPMMIASSRRSPMLSSSRPLAG